MRGDELVLAVRKALKGERYISSTLAEIPGGDLSIRLGKTLHEILSDREYQVMLMIASGKPVGAIAKRFAPEREDDQQLSDQYPAERRDEEQRGNNPLRHPEQTAVD